MPIKEVDRIATATLVKALQAECSAFYDAYFVDEFDVQQLAGHQQDHFNNIQNLVNILQARKSDTYLDKLFKELNR